VLQTGRAHAQNGAASKFQPQMQAPLGLDFFGPTIFDVTAPIGGPVEDALKQ
jgi:hypothetical protein